MYSDKLKELRLENELNQVDVAEKLDIAKSTYIKYEKNEQSPQLVILEKAAKLYGIPLTALIDEEEVSLDAEFKAKLKLIEELDEEEKKSLMIVLEGMVMRNQKNKLNKQFKGNLK